MIMNYKPSPAFVGASWVALGTGMIGYIIGLWRSDMQLNEKGYYFTVLMYGLFSGDCLPASCLSKITIPYQ
jgi:uncharacterized membrane protein YiaA